MALFGSSSKTPWGVDVLTTEFLFSGQVEPEAQKWGWAFFSPIEKTPAQPFDVAISAVRATGALKVPDPVPAAASFGWNTALVAIIARDAAAEATWDEWSASMGGQPVAAELLVGPYSVTGSVLSADGTLQQVLNDRFPIQNATITRVDGAGDGQPIQAAKAVLGTSFLQAALAR